MLLLAERDGMLCSVELAVRRDGEEAERMPPASSRPGIHPVLREAAGQLAAYFEGRLRRFDLPLSAGGTQFQERIWRALLKVEYGQWISYGALGDLAGCPKSARAVGMACHANPLPIVVPCHRVLAAGGRIGGYGWGEPVKRLLLHLEHITVHEDAQGRQ